MNVVKASQSPEPKSRFILKGVIMKSVLALALLVFSFSTIAATVKITSCQYIRTSNDMASLLAELCGLVEGGASPSFVRILVDHKTNKPATYNTVAGADGKFCATVTTYRGTAEVSRFGEKSVVTAKVE
jgi:hypothetical protein